MKSWVTSLITFYNMTLKSNIPQEEKIEADCLNRNPVLEPEENMEDQLKVVNLITLEDIMIDQNNN